MVKQIYFLILLHFSKEDLIYLNQIPVHYQPTPMHVVYTNCQACGTVSSYHTESRGSECLAEVSEHNWPLGKVKCTTCPLGKVQCTNWPFGKVYCTTCSLGKVQCTNWPFGKGQCANLLLGKEQFENLLLGKEQLANLLLGKLR